MKKTLIDFLYVYEDGKTVTISDYLFNSKMRQEFVGLTPVDRFKNCYTLYYDFSSRNGFPPKGFNGISLDELGDIRISTIPKDLVAIAIVFFDREAWLTSELRKSI